jgi:DNA modification methylase
VQPYYDDGTCTIYHGDCREVLPTLTADVLVTDPPYGIAHATGGGRDSPQAPWIDRGGRAIRGDDSTQLRDDVLAWWGDRPAAVFGTWKAPRPERPRAVLIWDKAGVGGMGYLPFPWQPSHEEIYILGKGWHGKREPSVLRSYLTPYPARGRCHPHEKPVDLLRRLLIKAPGGVVLDPFMGVGPTLRAAKDLGRRAIGIEIEERYCEIAARRLGQEVLAL